MGGAALRVGALSDPEVIDLINTEFVPVWINVRTTPLPRLPFWQDVLLNAKVGPDNRIEDLFSEGFFLRSVVTTPDGQTLLNPQAATVAGSLATSSREGHYAYAQTKRDDFLLMLKGALARYQRQALAPGR